MASDRIDLAELYKFDEIYWIPADRPSQPSEAESSLVMERQEVLPEQETTPSIPDSPIELPNISEESKVKEPQGPGLQASLMVEEKETKSSNSSERPNLASITCQLLIVGKINATEKERLQLVLSAAPVSLSTADWQVLEPVEEMNVEELVRETQASYYLFLGEQAPAWKETLAEAQIKSIDNKSVFYFPRLISSLKDSEKPLKLAFWNAMKEMVRNGK